MQASPDPWALSPKRQPGPDIQPGSAFAGNRHQKIGELRNGTVLDASDYLAYFGRDPEIKIVGMYLEG